MALSPVPGRRLVHGSTLNVSTEAIVTGVVSGLLVVLISGVCTRWLLPKVSSRFARLRDESRQAADEAAERYRDGMALLVELGGAVAIIVVAGVLTLLMLSTTALVTLISEANRRSNVSLPIGVLIWCTAVVGGLFVMTFVTVVFPIVRGVREARKRGVTFGLTTSPPPAPFEPIDFKS